MANTYTLIASNTLSSSAASVTFSSIPNTYTDLVVRCSVRSDYASTGDNITLTFNSNSSSIYSNTIVFGNGSSGVSQRNSAGNPGYVAYVVDGDVSTASTFGSVEIYLPSYTSSTNKPFSSFGARENNATAAVVAANAGLFASTSAISSIQIGLQFGPNFVSGSSFFLYGIKNS